ncbi:MAG TPA: hypothetical protein PKN29_09645, partial [Candidatus Ozemobacteraceae bacterium]|nr:hypothetical protein [Candidatus Ozemobacteraceae bacterium]
LMNMSNLKLQAEYRPRDSKHYFRLAGDLLNEMDDVVSNDLAKLRNNGTVANYNAAVAANTAGTNSGYDRWNNFNTADAKATVLTFEYRYQLAENTRIRVGFTSFDFQDNAHKANYTAAGAPAAGTAAISAGRGACVSDYDYNMFWAEIFSKF